jgi:hypothetical protein
VDLSRCYFGHRELTKFPTAYTIYSFFEWTLVLLDVGFDACTVFDFESFEITIRDVNGITRGYVPWLPK